MTQQADIIIVGAGLAGLTAAVELAERGKKIIIVDQENENSLGGQAFWSLGGLFMVDSPQQRVMGIKDSHELAMQDWLGTAQFDRPEDHWPRKWAESFVDFAAGEMQPWLKSLGMGWTVLVGWAERGGSLAHGHGNSVPRFHITKGLGPGVIEPFVNRTREAVKKGLITLACRHRVSNLITDNGAVTGVAGEILEEDNVARGQQSNRNIVGNFEFKADAVIITSGGIGGNPDLVKKNWPRDQLGNPPENFVLGVPHHVDGRMLEITEKAGGSIINSDRMWHYTEGLKNWDPIWPNHGIRILPGPSSLWFDAEGNRMPSPCFPGFDTRATLKHILSTGYDYSWFILTQKIIEKEFALSGSEQNFPLQTRSTLKLAMNLMGKARTASVEAFKKHGEDFIVKNNLTDLVAEMNKLAGKDLLNHDHIKMQIEARDRELTNEYSKDTQIHSIRNFRTYFGDRLFRTAKPHRILDPEAGPLIAVRLNILTRKTLGGLHTNLNSQVLDSNGTPVPGLYAAGEVAGFGGGGYHGYNALEGTFLGGCLFSGRIAGRSALT